MGRHQQSLPIALLMGRLTDEVRQESLWTMIFTDDMTCSESREYVKEEVEVCARKEKND